MHELEVMKKRYHIVVSEDLMDLPEVGEALYIRKDGQKIRFIDGNIERELPQGNGDKTKTL